MSLEIDTPSRPWRRSLGWLNWAVLEELALSAHQDAAGWSAPVGVRTIAVNLGMTKDTAARALTALAEAGVVKRGHVRTIDGRLRSGYRIQLPEGIAFLATGTAERNEHDFHVLAVPRWGDEAQPEGGSAIDHSNGARHRRDPPPRPTKGSRPPRPMDDKQDRLFDPESL